MTPKIPIDGDLESKQRLVEQFALLAGRADNRPEIAVARTERGDGRRELDALGPGPQRHMIALAMRRRHHTFLIADGKRKPGGVCPRDAKGSAFTVEQDVCRGFFQHEIEASLLVHEQ